MFQVRRLIIPASAVDDALYLIHDDLFEHGISTEQAHQWREDHHWFPHLEHSPVLTGLADFLPVEWTEGDMDPEAQIDLQYPCRRDVVYDQALHRDRRPTWPPERTWSTIVGIPLSYWTPTAGAERFADRGTVLTPFIGPGDAIMFTGDQPHGPGPNLTGAVRYGVYLRWQPHEEPTSLF